MNKKVVKSKKIFCCDVCNDIISVGNDRLVIGNSKNYNENTNICMGCKEVIEENELDSSLQVIMANKNLIMNEKEEKRKEKIKITDDYTETMCTIETRISKGEVWINMHDTKRKVVLTIKNLENIESSLNLIRANKNNLI